MIYAPRFLPTIGRPHAVALHFARCGQLTGGLAPPGVRPCWAHMIKRPCLDMAFFFDGAIGYFPDLRDDEELVNSYCFYREGTSYFCVFNKLIRLIKYWAL